MTSTHVVEYSGRLLTVNEVVKLTGLPEHTVLRRIRDKWTGYEIVNTPYKSKGVKPHD